MSAYYVGASKQFTHVDRDANGNVLTPVAGTWSSADPDTASISSSGLAQWIAPGATTLKFTASDGSRIGTLDVVVQLSPPVSLTASPSSVSVPIHGSVAVNITAVDAFSNPVTPLALSSVTVDDGTVARVVRGADASFVVVGVGVGGCVVTVHSGSASVTVPITGTALPATGVSSVFGRVGPVVKQTGDYVVGDITGAASTSDVSAAVAALVASAPAALDTLNEFALALGDDPNFATTITAALALKASTAALSAEASTRASANTTLQGNIDAEASTRASADTTLQSHIDSEASTRSAADVALQANIDAEAAARATAISAEVTARNTAISTSISSAIAALVNSAPGTLDTLGEIATALQADESGAAALAATVALKAPLASPALTGSPTAPTQAVLDNSTKIATTAYADAAVAAEAVLRAAADALKAPLASPAFTGHPTGVTETLGDATTKLATTAFVANAIAAIPAPTWTSITSKPTDLAGYSLTTDFNSKGDARWVPKTGGTVYDGTNNANTIEFQVGASSTQKNAAKFWGSVFLGQNNDKLIDSSNSGSLHVGSSGGVTLGLATGTVYLKAVAAGITLSAPLIIPTGAAPASSTAAGVTGQMAWDSTYEYRCTVGGAAGFATWQRWARSSF